MKNSSAVLELLQKVQESRTCGNENNLDQDTLLKSWGLSNALSTNTVIILL